MMTSPIRAERGWPRSRLLRVSLLGLLLLATAGCWAPPPGPEPTSVPATDVAREPATRPAATIVVLPTATATPTSSPTATPAPSPTATPSVTPVPLVLLALASELPEAVVRAAETWAADRGVLITEEDDAELRLDVTVGSGAELVHERLYVPVARFATLQQDVTLDELRDRWAGAAGTGRLLVTEETVADLTRLWGAASHVVEVVSGDALSAALWQDEEALAIVPFEGLQPRLRSLRLDGQSAVDNRLVQSDWPLALRVWLHGTGPEVRSLAMHLTEALPQTNREASKLTVLVMTGVTAMSRGTACVIERENDYAYPARVVGSELAAADITHISNEVPFVEGCEPRCWRDMLTLCSKPEYFAALDEVGVDIVGLTGNHQNDFGHEAMLTSLAFYVEQGIPVYGGGADEEAAREPLLLTDHGNRLAFLGANQFGPDRSPSYPQGAWAVGDDPGSARFDLEAMKADITAARSQADVVLVELQYQEAYQTEPLAEQREDFTALSAAGADIVTGVQAHQPQALEFTARGIILYGLGNLFFDQMDWWETRQGLIARHVIYDGEHISTELLVTILEDWAQPRWATPDERAEVLNAVFGASGW